MSGFKFNTLNMDSAFLMLRKVNPTCVALTFYLIAIILFIWKYHLGEVDNDLFYNADALYLPSVFKSVFLDGYSFTDWTLAPSLYLFPDAFIYYFGSLITSSVYDQILIYALLQSLLFFIVTSLVLTEFIGLNKALVASALICSNTILLGMYSSEPYGVSLISSFHFGSLLSYLVLILLLLKYVLTNVVKYKLYLPFFIVFFGVISVLSDRIILIQLYLPVLAIGIYYSIHKKNNHIIIFGALLIFSYFVAIIFAKFYLPQTADLSSSIGISTLQSRLAMLFFYAIKLPLIIQIALSISGIAFAWICIYWYKNFCSKDLLSFKNSLPALLFIMSAVFMFIATCLSDRTFMSRYFLPYFLLAPIFFFAFSSNNYFKFGILFYSAFYGILLTLILNTPGRPNSTALDVKGFVGCVNQITMKHSATNGIAGYWDAVPLYVFGNVGTSVVSVINDLSPMKFIYNHREIGRKFSFAVIDDKEDGMYRLSRSQIEGRLKNSPIEYQCSGKTVLIFDREDIVLPKNSSLIGVRRSILSSFIQNPRALLIMAQAEAEKGNEYFASQLLDEAIALLVENGAKKEIIAQYEVKRNELLNFTRH